MDRIKSFILLLFLNPVFINPFFSISSSDEYLKNGIVKIKAVHMDRIEKTGTGFIVKKTDNSVLILTAYHVIETEKRPEIIFYKQPFDKKYTAEIVNLEPDIDISGGTRGIALLKVQGQIPQNVIALELSELLELDSSLDVLTIGFPITLGVDWAVSSGRIKGLKGKDLMVSIDVQKGNSGGPLLQSGKVSGIITECLDRTGIVVPSSIILLTLKGWGIQLNETYNAEESYWELIVSNISFLPYFYEGFLAGDPDYRLVVNIGYSSFNINIDKKSGTNVWQAQKSIPFLIKDIEFYEFKIIEADLLSSDDFTSVLRVDKNKLFTKNDYELPFLNDVIMQFKDQMGNRKSSRLTLYLQKFDPEKNSSYDQNISTPLLIEPRAIHYDKINFNNSDSTDYLMVSPNNNLTETLILLTSNYNNSFKIVKNKENLKVWNKFGNYIDNNREEAYIIEGNYDFIMEMHASNAFENADYLIFSFPDTEKIPSFIYFIDNLIKNESDSNDKIPFAGYGEIIKKLRSNLNITGENLVSLINIVNKHFKLGTEHQQNMLINILEEDIEVYAKANKINTVPSNDLEMLILLKKAEGGGINKSEELYPLLKFRNNSLLVRAIKLIGSLGNKENDIKEINPFLNHKNYDIQSAAKTAIDNITSNMSK